MYYIIYTLSKKENSRFESNEQFKKTYTLTKNNFFRNLSFSIQASESNGKITKDTQD